jgi:hypothetical protein
MALFKLSEREKAGDVDQAHRNDQESHSVVMMRIASTVTRKAE